MREVPSPAIRALVDEDFGRIFAPRAALGRLARLDARVVAPLASARSELPLVHRLSLMIRRDGPFVSFLPQREQYATLAHEAGRGTRDKQGRPDVLLAKERRGGPGYELPVLLAL